MLPDSLHERNVSASQLFGIGSVGGLVLCSGGRLGRCKFYAPSLPPLTDRNTYTGLVSVSLVRPAVMSIIYAVKFLVLPHALSWINTRES